jgi:(p)ppGpp synthase/HD superfamily hydrolase
LRKTVPAAAAPVAVAAERAQMMAASVASAATARGLEPSDVDVLGRAHALAMQPRLEALEDDHHPAYLHPGRTVLVLLHDVGEVPLDALCAAAVHETEDNNLRVSSDAVREALGDTVADLVGALPLPGDERLLERLVTLEQEPLLAALAERLDQLRHAHLREDDSWWRAIHEEAVSAWVPVAERTHPRLADRYRHWQRTFERRLKKI